MHKKEKRFDGVAEARGTSKTTLEESEQREKLLRKECEKLLIFKGGGSV